MRAMYRSAARGSYKVCKVAPLLAGFMLVGLGSASSRAEPASELAAAELPEPPPGSAAAFDVRIEGRSLLISENRAGSDNTVTVIELPQAVVAWVRHARFLYAADDRGLLVIDITDPFKPAVIRTIPGFPKITRMTLRPDGAQLFALDQARHVHSFSVPEPGRILLPLPNGPDQSGGEVVRRPSALSPRKRREGGALIAGGLLTLAAGGALLGFGIYSYNGPMTSETRRWGEIVYPILFSGAAAISLTGLGLCIHGTIKATGIGQ